MSEYSVAYLALKEHEVALDMGGVLAEIVRMFRVIYNFRHIVFEVLGEQDVLGKR